MAVCDADQVSHVLACVDSVEREISSLRARLRHSWLLHIEAITRVEAQLNAVDLVLTNREQQLSEMVSHFGNAPSIGASYTGPAATLGSWLEGPSGDNGVFAVKREIECLFDEDLEQARLKFAESQLKIFSGGAKRAGAEALGRYSLRLAALRALRDRAAAELARANEHLDEAMVHERAAADKALESTLTLARQGLESLPVAMQPWATGAWRDWTAPEPVTGVTGLFAGTLSPLADGDLGPNERFGTDIHVPIFLTLRQNLQLSFADRNGRRIAIELARSLILRELVSTTPGELEVTFFDPVGLGQSAGELLELAEYDPNLIGGKVWSSTPDLLDRLAQLTTHIELVTQKYLRSSFETIDAFNSAAGEVSEPYRLLVLFDFPSGLSEEAMGRLKVVAANGPRCGVRILLLTDASVEAPYGVRPAQLSGHLCSINVDESFTVTHGEYTLQLCPQYEKTPVDAKRLVDGVGRKAMKRAHSAVGFDTVMELFAGVADRGIRTDLSPTVARVRTDDISTWWKEDSSRGLFVPIGQKGAREVAILGFDSSNRSGALLVGRPGSGKSTLLHTCIGGLATLYGPGQLELYLVDFKEGVEFKSYAAEGLPHARVVAIESDREFGVSILESLTDELTRRGELFRSAGGRHAGIREFRTDFGEALPRVLLIFDEFQVLFAKNDRIGIAAADLLETIIRQGRGFGVHVLLGSQSLSGIDALGAHVPQLLTTRILLPASDLDARRVLGDNNDAGRYLTSHGEGILNSAGGAVEANERFRGALFDESERRRWLRSLRDKADISGFTRSPRVFEGNASISMETFEVAQFCEEMTSTGTEPIRLCVGSPMATSGLADLYLKRESGANVLAVVRNGKAQGVDIQPRSGPAYGLLAATVASAAQSAARIDIIDFMSVDDGLEETLEPFLSAGRIVLRRRRAFSPLVADLGAEVTRRVELDESHRPAWLAVLFGVHRARELDSEIGSLDADPEQAEMLERVMRDGPEVGVHVWLWSDSVGGAARRLSSRMIRECSWRIAGKMSPDDSLSLIGTEAAARN